MNVFHGQDHEPQFSSVEELREHRKAEVVLGYRLFGAHHWGELGDGHITARDPERTDHFWLLRYDVAFAHATVDDLILVAPDGTVAEGEGLVNSAAYFIHAPIHDARPDVVCAAHTHTPYGTPWSAFVEPLRMLSQECCAFIDNQSVFDDPELDIVQLDGGKRIAVALAENSLVWLRNHGTLTVGASVAEAVGWFVLAERAAEVNVKARDGHAIADDDARLVAESMRPPAVGRKVFEWLVNSKLKGSAQ